MLTLNILAECADLHPCPLQFVDKEPTLAEPVLSQLLKFWPVINSQKEVLFLGEMEEILELTQVRNPGRGFGSLEPQMGGWLSMRSQPEPVTAGRLAQHAQPVWSQAQLGGWLGMRSQPRPPVLPKPGLSMHM